MVRQFQYKIKFVGGISNAASDALSRFIIYGPEDEDDSEPGIVHNNLCLVQEQSKQTQDEDLNTLRKWIVSKTRPEKLPEGNTAE